MLPWVFYMVMALPSYGGPDKAVPVPILVTIQTADEKSCRDFHKFLTKQIKDMQFKYEILPCVVKPK